MTLDLPATRSCTECPLEHLAPWAGVDAGRIDIVDRMRRRRVLDEGETLFRQGDANDGLYCVREGVFGISITHENGTEIMIRMAYPGDTLGARAFLRNAAHQTSAVALTRAGVCMLQRRDALRLTRDAPSVHLELVNRCLRAMDRVEANLVEQSCLSNRARLCRMLADLLEHHGSDAGGAHVARLPINRRTMAGMLGIQPESLSRLFSRLRQEGLIALSGRHVSTRSLDRLRHEAGREAA